MVQSNEIVMFIMGIGVLIFIMKNSEELVYIPHHKLLLRSFYVLLGAWFFTNIEALIATQICNIAEHVCYVCSSILLTLWLFRMGFKKEEAE